MNRTQRAKIRLLRSVQNTARDDKNREISEYRRKEVICRSRTEKRMKRIVIAKKNEFRKEAVYK